MADGKDPEEPTFGVAHDRYALEEIVGSGGMGVVYRGRDRVLGRTVAVKMIRQELAGEEFVKRFEREAAILARLRSPYIVVVYDYGEHDDDFFMVTDFLTEGDLAGWLERNGPMPAADALPLVAKLAEGLADAHEAGVLHRDIKPANTLLWRRGGRLHPVLADFGIAVTSDLTLTKTGAIVGSPLYMAPERHRGEPATVASDIYAMGCLLYAILTGRPPFWGGTEFQAASAHLNDPVPALPDSVPHASDIDAVIAGCMAKRPEDRIPTAAELADRLRRVARKVAPADSLVEPGPPAPVPGEPAEPGPSDRREVPPTGATTVLSPTMPGSSPRPPAPPTEAPPTAPPPSTDGGRRRRSPVALAAAATVAVVAAVAGGWWALAGDKDPSTAGSSPGSDGPTTPGASESGSVSAAPPAAPERVRVTAKPGDLEVRFRVTLPVPPDGLIYRLERDQDGWRPSRPSFRVPTPVGGRQRCVTVRLVAVSEGGETPGPTSKACDRSRPQDIRLVPNSASCTYPPPYDATIPCRYWDIELSGFAAERPLRITVTHDLDPESLELSFTTDRVGYFYFGARTDSFGTHRGGVRIPAAASRITVTAGGRTEVFEGDDLR